MLHPSPSTPSQPRPRHIALAFLLFACTFFSVVAAGCSSSITGQSQQITTPISHPPQNTEPPSPLPPPPPPKQPAELPPTPPLLADATRSVLAGLPVKGRAPKSGYAREQFGQRWSDDVTAELGHNGCDTRNDILGRDLINKEYKPGTRNCVVLSGQLHDPYTGTAISFVRGAKTSQAVQIDHVVALSDAWQKGAQQLTPEQRRELANDPLNLLAVDGPANQQKKDGDAATWMPSNSAFRCQYVARQVAVKRKYSLWVTPAERNAMERWLDSCTQEDEPSLELLQFSSPPQFR